MRGRFFFTRGLLKVDDLPGRPCLFKTGLWRRRGVESLSKSKSSSALASASRGISAASLGGQHDRQRRKRPQGQQQFFWQARQQHPRHTIKAKEAMTVMAPSPRDSA